MELAGKRWRWGLDRFSRELAAASPVLV